MQSNIEDLPAEDYTSPNQSLLPRIPFQRTHQHRALLALMMYMERFNRFCQYLQHLKREFVRTITSRETAIAAGIIFTGAWFLFVIFILSRDLHYCNEKTDGLFKTVKNLQDYNDKLAKFLKKLGYKNIRRGQGGSWELHFIHFVL